MPHLAACAFVDTWLWLSDVDHVSDALEKIARELK